MKVRTWILAFAVALSLSGCSLLTYTPARDAPNDPRAPVAPPVFDPTGGIVAIGQTVQITCATAGATISYTVNGTSADVTDADPAYSGPVSLSTAGAVTVRARAYKSGRTASDTVAVDFTVSADIVAMPSFSPSGGAIPSGQTITITCATGGADIRYTMDGTDPSESSTLYSDTAQPAITAAVTLKAKAYKSGMSPSATASASYTLTTNPTVLTPSYNPPPGPIPVGGTVQISCATPGASIYYTTDGATDPTESSTAYNDAARPAIAQNTTLKAKAFKTGMDPSGTATANYSVSVAAPVFNPAPGILSYGTAIQILCDTAGASIYFTTDGTTDPTLSSTPYNDAARPVLTVASTTFRAKAFKTGLNPSATTTASYVATYSAPTAPALSLPTDALTEVDPTSVSFQWAASTDPDPGDTVTYDVYVDTVNPPTNRRTSTPIAGTTFPLTGLSNSVTYYWRVKAYDLHGFSTPSVVRSFATRSPTVVTVGMYMSAAAVWTGTSRAAIETGAQIAYGVTASGGTLYVVGQYWDGSNFLPCYWSKSTSTWSRTTLDRPSGDGIYDGATAIVIDGTTAYTAGTCYPSSHYLGRSWVATTGTDLPYKVGSVASYSYGIAVSSGTAQVAGYSESATGYTACYWTVSAGVATRHDLSQIAENGKAYAVGISGSNVYVAGMDAGYAFYWWWNGATTTKVQLMAAGGGAYPGTVQAVAVSGGKVYFAGSTAGDYSVWTYDGTTTTCTSLKLPTDITVTSVYSGHSLAVAADGTVYVPGSIYDGVAAKMYMYYWPGTGADPVALGNNSAGQNAAMGITLVP